MIISWTSDNGPVVHEETGFELSNPATTTVSLDPPKISPIAFRNIVIQLNSDYPEAGMTVDDFVLF